MTDAQIDDICLSYRHDFSLMDKREKDRVRHQCQEWMRAARVQEMIEAEREACAKVAEEYAAWHTPVENEYQSAQHDSGKFLAAAIRARGQ